MKGEVLLLNGDSMSPYLKNGDLLLCQNLVGRLRPGQIAVAKDNKTQNILIHRYIGPEKFKGDNVKRFDQEYGTDLSYQKIVCAKIKDNNVIPLSFFWLHQLIAKLSNFNHAKLPILHRLFSLQVKVLASLCAYLEQQKGSTHE